MAEEQDKAIEKDRETAKPAGGQDNELSDKDLGKVTGGTGFLSIGDIKGESQDDHLTGP